MRSLQSNKKLITYKKNNLSGADGEYDFNFSPSTFIENITQPVTPEPPFLFLNRNWKADTYVWCECRNQIRRDDAADGSDPVHDGHQTARVIRTQIEPVALHSAVEAAHQAHGDGEHAHRQHPVAARIRGRHYEDGWAD